MISILRNSILAATVLAAGLATNASAGPQFAIRDNSALPTPGANDAGAFTRSSIDVTASPVGGTGSNIKAGAFGLQRTPAPSSAGSIWTNFLTYCFEYNVNLGLPSATPHTYEARLLTTSMSAADSTLIGKLWNLYFAQATTNAASNITVGDVSNTTQAERSAAFQVAIWNIVYDSDLNVEDGAFKVDTPGERIEDIANKYLADANAGSTAANIVGLYSSYYQDLLIPCVDAFGANSKECNPGGGDKPVPVPATLVLFGAGLLALAGMRRRKA